MANWLQWNGGPVNGPPAVSPIRYIELADSLGTSDATLFDMIGIYAEAIASGDDTSVVLSVVNDVTEGVGVAAATAYVFETLQAEAIEVSVAMDLATAAVFVEKLVATDAVSGVLSAVIAVASAMALNETVQQGFQADIDEIAQLADSYTTQLLALFAGTETVEISDAVSGYAVVSVELAEAVQSGDALDLQTVFDNEVEEGISAQVALVLGSDVYTGWVMNTKTEAVSRYEDFTFNSLGELEGSYFGAKSDGIYELTGSTDDGAAISASILTGLLDFGSKAMKGLDHAEIGVLKAGQLVLKVTYSDGDTKREVWHKLRQSNKTENNYDTPGAKGMRSVFYQFELVNVDGGEFDLTGAQWFPVDLRRGV